MKAVNDTIRENGLIPSRLDFGTLPRFLILNTNLPKQKERLAAVKTALAETNAIVAQRWLPPALQKSVHLATDRVCKIGEDVLIYFETQDKWLGPFKTVHVDGKTIAGEIWEGSFKSFNSFQVKPFYKNVSQNFHILRSDNDLSFFILNTFLTEVIVSYDPRLQ